MASSWASSSSQSLVADAATASSLIPRRHARQISPKSIVSDACASYATIDRANDNIKPTLDDLTRTTDFFSHYRLNLFNKKCPFWDDSNSMCGNQACAVLTLDNEDDIPKIWRTSELSKLEGPSAKHPPRRVQAERPERPLQGKLGEDVGESCVVEYDDECDDRDYCVPEDERASSKGDYVSLLQNPERFTGYSGTGARQVWDTIYRENCFQRSSFPSSAGLGISHWPGFQGPAAFDLKQVLEAAGRQELLKQHQEHSPLPPLTAHTVLELEDECLEKRVFYRVVSGMHASISAHLCWDFFNQTTGEWHPNLQCYRDRLGEYPERISNLYFDYALITRAIAKLGPYLADPKHYTFCMGDPIHDDQTRTKVAKVVAGAAATPPLFDESLMFKNGEGPFLKEEFRQRFRNVSRLMDCVGCDKCRLWGKIQTVGYGTALKVLFEMDNSKGADSLEPPHLSRTELVALFNTYARISSSVDSIRKFRVMAGAEDLAKTATVAEEAAAGKVPGLPDQAKKPHFTQLETPEPEQGNLSDTSPPISEIFDTELHRVMKALRIVITSWFRVPGAMYVPLRLSSAILHFP